MQRLRKLAVIVGAAVLAVALFAALRPDDGDDEEPTASPRATTAPSRRTRRMQARPRPYDVFARISVRVARGRPRVQRIRASRGERVLLHVGADVADEVHLHGYDVTARVAPRRPARLRFRARLVGRFELELEERHVPIAQLEVRP